VAGPVAAGASVPSGRLLSAPASQALYTSPFWACGRFSTATSSASLRSTWSRQAEFPVAPDAGGAAAGAADAAAGEGSASTTTSKVGVGAAKLALADASIGAGAAADSAAGGSGCTAVSGAGLAGAVAAAPQALRISASKTETHMIWSFTLFLAWLSCRRGDNRRAWSNLELGYCSAGSRPKPDM
jgi:hypothetical protein